MDYREHIQRSIDYIESHLGERITVEGLAAREGFSACHYYRVFAAYTGLPVMGYVRKRRLEHADLSSSESSRTP